MTKKGIEDLKNEMWFKIVCDKVTKEEAISEYMKLGKSRENAEIAYNLIKSDAVKAEHNLL